MPTKLGSKPRAKKTKSLPQIVILYTEFFIYFCIPWNSYRGRGKYSVLIFHKISSDNLTGNF